MKSFLEDAADQKNVFKKSAKRVLRPEVKCMEGEKR